MFKELTLQNIWKSDMPVENGRRFKFKSAVWGPTLVEGLRRQSSFLLIFQDGLRPQDTYFLNFFFQKCVKDGWLQWRAQSLKIFFWKILALESSKVERDRHFPRWISPIFWLFFQNFFSSTESFNPPIVARKLFRSRRFRFCSKGLKYDQTLV